MSSQKSSNAPQAMWPYNLWMTPWANYFKAPLSGNVTQDINPITNWLSPNIELNFAGNQNIETSVIREVASYGTQLGKLTEAVLELANGEKGEALETLEKLHLDIEEAKKRVAENTPKLEDQLQSLINELRNQNPEALERILSENQ